MPITTKNGSVVSDEQLEALAEMFERGEWPAGETRVVRGRPLKFGEELASVAFKSPQRELFEMDARTERGGTSRSDYLRRLVDLDLALPQLAKSLKIKLMFYFSCIN